MKKNLNVGSVQDDAEENNELPETPKAEPGAAPVVDLDEVEAREEEESETAATREEKKQNRYWMNRQKEDEYRRQIEERDRREAAAQQQLNSLMEMNRQLLSRQQTPQEQQRDPIDGEIEFLNRRADVIRKEAEVLHAQGKLTPERRAQLEKELLDTEQGVIDKRVEKQLRNRIPNQSINPEAAAFTAHVNNTYPDVVAHPNAMLWAKNWEGMEIASGRKPTLEQIMAATRKNYGLGQHAHSAPRPQSPGLRERLSGPPRGASGNGGGQGGRTFAFTKETVKMANEMYSHIPDEKKRLEKFAKLHSKGQS